MNRKKFVTNQLVLLTAIAALFFSLTTNGLAQDPISLEKALDIAAKNSPDIRRSELNLERSQQSLNAQKASLKSSFSLTLTPFNYEKTRQFNTFFSTWNTEENKQSSGVFTIAQPIKWTDGTFAIYNRFSWQDSYSEYQDVRTKSFSNNLYLNYQQPMFTYNRTKLTLKELELDLENTALSYAIQKLSLEKDVTQAFFTVYKNKMSLEIAIDEFNNREQSYTIIKNKVEAGLAAKEELYQAELDMASSKSNVQNSQVALDNSMDAFKQMIGLSLFDDITVTADVSHQAVEVDLQQALGHGLKHRMELRQRQIDIENSRFDLIQTSATNEFKGNINLSYGIIGTDEEFEQMYEVPTRNQQFSLSFDIPLFDWGAKKMRIKASEAVVKSRQLSLEDQKNTIIIGVRQAYRDLKNLVNQIEIARQNLRNAQLTYDINLERYKNGDLTSMDLNLYQNQLSEKKMGHVTALIDYKIALLNMKIQSLWDFQRDKAVVPELSDE